MIFRLVLLALLVTGCAHANEWPIVIEHSQGKTVLTKSPQRVVSLDPVYTDTLLALGLPPVGSITYGVAPADQLAAWAPAIARRAVDAGIATVGSPGNGNMEAIAALEPDLILVSEYRGRRLYGLLERIAPTVVVDRRERHFRDGLFQIASIIGKQAEAAAIMDEYRKRTAKLKRTIGGRRVAIVRPRQQSVWMSGPPSNPGRVLADAGVDVEPVPQGASITADTPGAIGELSLERIVTIDAPHLFIILYNLDHHDGLGGYLQGPMWQRLPAVKQGNVYGVQGFAWTNHGPIGAMTMLTEAARALNGSRQ